MMIMNNPQNLKKLSEPPRHVCVGFYSLDEYSDSGHSRFECWVRDLLDGLLEILL